jgi:hypothetical protein
MSRGLDSYRSELVIRAAEYLLRQRARFGSDAPFEATWPAEARDLAIERGWFDDEPAPEALAAEREAVVAARRADPDPLLTSLARQLDLDEPAIRLLACCAIAQVDPSVLRLWHALRPCAAAAPFSLGTWLEILGDRGALYAAVDSLAPLRRLRLIDVVAQGPSELTAAIQVPPRVVAALLGHEARRAGTDDDRVPSRAVIVAPTLDPGDLALAAPTLEQLDRVTNLLDRRARIVFVGVAGSGRASLARCLAHHHWPAVVAIDPNVAGERAIDVVVWGLREAVLRDALPIVRLEAKSAVDGVLDHLARFESMVVATGSPAVVGPLLAAIPAATTFTVEPLPAALQQTLWSRRFRDAGVAVAPELPARIATTYDMVPRDIVAVADRLCRDQAATLELGHVRDAVRGSATTELFGLASRVATTLSWSDVVLPQTTLDLLTEMVSHARHRTAVFDDWGFGRKIAYGRALSALFYGPPGTGKTLAATLIAADLGRDVYRVDLSRIIDKYVGETEKNLERIFTEARRSHAMLLFDEADSLFAKRTNVESANDRYANLAVNFLLQALEEFDGICILTTNLDGSIDEAFRRRLRFRIEFPRPTTDEQVTLWKTMMTHEARVADDIPWHEIAEEFPEMTGGHIRNAVLRSAFLAVAEGGMIDTVRIRRAARAEYEELGHIVSSQSL